MIKGFRSTSDVEQFKYRLKHLKQHAGQRTRDFIYRIKEQYAMAYGPEVASSEETSAKRLRDEILRPILVEGMRQLQKAIPQ